VPTMVDRILVRNNPAAQGLIGNTLADPAK
jgi:hypothetical protein